MRSVLIEAGGHFRKRTASRIVAISKCSLLLRAERFVVPCEEALVQFERILRRRHDKEVMYEWANIRRCGLRVTFEVNWYDLQFFHARKAAYRVGPHALAFQRFGATHDDFRIVHRVLA
jgi:hypothetical protein